MTKTSQRKKNAAKKARQRARKAEDRRWDAICAETGFMDKLPDWDDIPDTLQSFAFRYGFEITEECDGYHQYIQGEWGTVEQFNRGLVLHVTRSTIYPERSRNLWAECVRAHMHPHAGHLEFNSLTNSWQLSIVLRILRGGEEIAEYAKAKYQNPIGARIRQRAYQARQSGLKADFTLDQWWEMTDLCNYTCLNCGSQEPEITLVPDHILPHSLGGAFTASNIQPLCAGCNNSKRSHTMDYRPEFIRVKFSPVQTAIQAEGQ